MISRQDQETQCYFMYLFCRNKDGALSQSSHIILMLVSSLSGFNSGPSKGGVFFAFLVKILATIPPVGKGIKENGGFRNESLVTHLDQANERIPTIFGTMWGTGSNGDVKASIQVLKKAQHVKISHIPTYGNNFK